MLQVLLCLRDVPIGEDYVLAEKNTPVRYVIPENQTLNVYWNKVTEREFDNVLKKWRADVFKVDSGIRYGRYGTGSDDTVSGFRRNCRATRALLTVSLRVMQLLQALYTECIATMSW